MQLCDAGCSVVGQIVTCELPASLGVGISNAATHTVLLSGNGLTASTEQLVTTYVDIVAGAPDSNITNNAPASLYVTVVRTCSRYNIDGSPFTGCTPIGSYVYNNAADASTQPNLATCCVRAGCRQYQA
jgi:hypothetical protein